MRPEEIKERLRQRGSKPGLERIRAFLDALGNPGEELQVIHIAGTNGKGSTMAYLESALMEGGYTVGCYSSPPVFAPFEHIRINREMIPQEIYDSHILNYADLMPEDITLFEAETGLALRYFADQKTDYAIIECGMGGRADATNIFTKPLCTVLTSISLDHQQFLGDTVEAITREKCGILREGVPCVSYGLTEQIQESAKEIGARLIVPDLSELEVLSSEEIGKERFSYEGETYEIPLAGTHQIRNALTALEVLRVVGIKPEVIKAGLAHAQWPGRLEILRKDPLFLRDGAHNPDGARALAEVLSKHFTNRRILYIIGVLRDKDYPSMLASLLPLSAKVFCITVPETERALPAEELLAEVRKYDVEAVIASSPEEACKMALAEAGAEDVIVAWGSLYYMRRLDVSK